MRNAMMLTALTILLTACGPAPTNLATDAQPPVQCNADQECTVDCSGFDSFSCSSKGICICKSKPAQCSADSECTTQCAGFDTAACKAGACQCSKTTEKCPALTRAEFVEMLYLFMGYDRCPDSKLKKSCSDVKDSLLACKWKTLQDEGILDLSNMNGTCSPNTKLNRAEIIKIVITAIDGLNSYTAPASPTYKDVKSADWYFDYVEAATQLGLVSGYKDANGSLTGKFGPTDKADQCWAYNMMKLAFPSTAANPTNTTLAVQIASTPTSQTYVKGETAPALGIAMTAGSSGDVKVKQLTVRTYADSAPGAFFSATGDTPANTVVANVTLYDGNNLVAGPATLSLVDTGASGFVPDSGDYYKATFKNLSLTVGKGSTKMFTVKVGLKNTMTATRYLAVDVVPPVDVVAEDSSAKAVIPTGGALNSAPHSPELTIVTAGTLIASSEGNPNAAIVVAGTNNKKVSRYRFHALREGYTVNKVTVVNDVAGAFDVPVATSAVSSVTIKYPDVNGVIQTRSGSLVAGSIVMSNMKFYVPNGQDAYLEIYVDVNTLASVGESLSGQTIRLGISDTGNTVATFDAIGKLSSATVNSPTISNGSAVNQFVVRKSVPTFTKVPGLSTTLVIGQNNLTSVKICANSAGSVSFGRTTFRVTSSGYLPLMDFALLRGGTKLTTVNIYAGSTNVAQGSGAGVVFGDLLVVVSFNQEETISAGSCSTFSLRAELKSAPSTGTTVATRLVVSTTTEPQLLSPCYHGNTGRVYAVNGSALLATNSFTAHVQGAEMIWSDKSADAHSYPTIQKGVVVAGSGSCDYTNGWGLNVTELPPHTLTF